MEQVRKGLLGGGSDIRSIRKLANIWRKGEREQEIVKTFSNDEQINPLYSKTSGNNVFSTKQRYISKSPIYSPSIFKSNGAGTCYKQRMDFSINNVLSDC